MLRLTRPLIRRYLRGRRLLPAPSFLSDEEKSGPFAAYLNDFDGIPLGQKLRQILDDTWASPSLTNRAKALAFALVARGPGGS